MPTIPLIIDTDAGTDDLMAIAYLLGEPEVGLEAITVVHGLAHVRQGARNLRRLLLVAGRPDIPVFEGEDKPLRGSRQFPPSWRKLTDDSPGIRLPGLAHKGLRKWAPWSFCAGDSAIKRNPCECWRSVR